MSQDTSFLTRHIVSNRTIPQPQSTHQTHQQPLSPLYSKTASVLCGATSGFVLSLARGAILALVSPGDGMADDEDVVLITSPPCTPITSAADEVRVIALLNSTTATGLLVSWLLSRLSR